MLACVAVLLAFVVAFGTLLLVTPSVGNARQLARAFDRAHHAAYPGVVVPYRFATSLEATEDHRFNSEPGVDPIAIVRVIYSFVTRQGDQGGATLYQQLAKMLYTPAQTGFVAEAEQIALAVKLKFSYSRPEILRLYADVAYFGHGFYGLAAASCGYFGVRPDQLSWPQAALLAGLVQAPQCRRSADLSCRTAWPGNSTSSAGWWPSARSPRRRRTGIWPSRCAACSPGLAAAGPDRASRPGAARPRSR